VSLIKIYFEPGTDPDADLGEISNLAMADLRKLPPGTLPPVVLKFDASSLPVCLITLKGQGLCPLRGFHVNRGVQTNRRRTRLNAFRRYWS
jgi:multidrug efflux pump subunit AcrB